MGVSAALCSSDDTSCIASSVRSADERMVRISLFSRPLSSSVRIDRFLCVAHHSAYGPRCRFQPRVALLNRAIVLASRAFVRSGYLLGLPLFGNDPWGLITEACGRS
jgi:hypothetical protein